MELALIFSLAGVAIAICAIIAVIIVFTKADRQIINNIKNNKIMMQGNRNDVIRFKTILSAKRLAVTEVNKVSKNYGKIVIVNNKTDNEMRNIDGNLIINSYEGSASLTIGGPGDIYGYMNTKILNNTGRDIYIQLVSCRPDPDLDTSTIENIHTTTYFEPTVIMNGTITDFPFICMMMMLQPPTATANRFAVDFSISDSGVVEEDNKKKRE